ncbi:MAG: NAD-dependent epimerase/dehydratase family protein, partial [Chloroflexota bacterium]
MIFLTGGTGFLGRHLVPALCRAGFSMRVLTRHPQANDWLKRYPNVEVIAGDLQDTAVLQKAAEGCRYIIHAGGMFRFWGDEQAFAATNAHGTENVLEAAYKAKVERFIHISTIAVVGEPDPKRIVDETHPAHPTDAYQRSKWEAEQ